MNVPTTQPADDGLRRVPGTQTTGWVSLRYAPRPPSPKGPASTSVAPPRPPREAR